MERIDFRIEFLEIAFKVKSKRPFSVHLIAQSAGNPPLIQMDRSCVQNRF
jgi:hypothetical protein